MRLGTRRREDISASWNAVEGDRSQIRVGRGKAEIIKLGQGDPIVMVPGLAGGWKLLAPLARSLARTNQVVLYDMRGDRDWIGSPTALDLGEYANDLAAVIEGAGLERPAVYGVSFGGAVALEDALAHPGHVSSLILQGVEAQFERTIGSHIVRWALDRYPLPADSRFINQFFNLLHGKKPQPGPLVDFIAERIWKTDQSVIANRLALVEQFDVSDRLWQLDLPTMVVAGTRDAIITPARQRQLADSIAGAKFQAIEGAGHVGFLTHRKETVAAVREFVRSLAHSSC
jgi:pimeloyl-ACP methyl ester carboxylesterase